MVLGRSTERVMSTSRKSILLGSTFMPQGMLPPEEETYYGALDSTYGDMFSDDEYVLLEEDHLPSREIRGSIRVSSLSAGPRPRVPAGHPLHGRRHRP
jgi:hypothetical protein